MQLDLGVSFHHANRGEVAFVHQADEGLYIANFHSASFLAVVQLVMIVRMAAYFPCRLGEARNLRRETYTRGDICLRTRVGE